MNESPITQLSLTRWTELVGGMFHVALAGKERCRLELTAVATPGSEAGGRYESFSLMFDGPGDRVLPQQIYSFEHEQLGRFELFIVPVGNERGRLQYQAVFNRLRVGQTLPPL